MGFAYITANLAKGVRYDTMEDKQFMVVPTVMIVEGVLNGSGGPLLYSAEELEKAPESWNHKPIVVYHPQMNGNPVSACDPDILTSRKVGYIMRTNYKDGKLRAEAWLDPERLKKIDNRVYIALENGQKVEVSTGLFSDKEESSGTFNGEQYEAIARNFKPDHLAILPDIKGACSIEQGAGLLANESYEDIRVKLENQLREKFPKDSDSFSTIWIEATFDGYVIFTYKSVYYTATYIKGELGDPELTSEPKEVERVVQYRLKENGKFLVASKREDKEMERKEIEKEIVANDAVWSLEVLKHMSNEQVTALHKRVVVNKEKEKENKPKKEEEVSIPVPVVNKEQKQESKPISVDQYIANAPSEIQSVLRAGLHTYEEQKAGLIATLIKNKRCTFTEACLRQKDLPELKALVKLAINEKDEKQDAPTYDYSGMAPVTVNVADEEPLLMPSIF